MMVENLNLRDVLEWYLEAGVDVTVADAPFGLSLTNNKNPILTDIKNQPVLNVDIPLRKKSSDNLDTPPDKTLDVRPATTELAQATLSACHNAQNIAKNASSLDELKTLITDFDGCSLKLTASHTVFGEGNPQAKIMLIGEAPGADEDRIGIPFVGKSGKLLDEILNAAGFSRNEDCFIANVLPWRPPGNRTPTTAEVAVCLPFLKRQIELVKPKALVLLGGSSANALFDNQEPISKLRGKWWEYPLEDGTIIPSIATFHPAYLLRNPAQKAKIWSDFLRLKKFFS